MALIWSVKIYSSCVIDKMCWINVQISHNLIKWQNGLVAMYGLSLLLIVAGWVGRQFWQYSNSNARTGSHQSQERQRLQPGMSAMREKGTFGKIVTAHFSEFTEGEKNIMKGVTSQLGWSKYCADVCKMFQLWNTVISLEHHPFCLGICYSKLICFWRF